MASPSCIILLLLALAINSSANFCMAATSTGNSTKPSPAEVRSQFVETHNAARRVIGVPPLSWDAKLAKYAKAYANERRGDCRLVHSPGYAYGENIFWGQGRRWSVPDAVQKWIDEKQWYNYDNNSCSAAECSHYTQVVWRNTLLIGCAKIICNSGDTFIVCEYHPPGNYVNSRPY